MSKVSVKCELKSKDGVHIFEGKGIKNGDKIIYNDDGVMTTITLGDVIFLERKRDYFIKLGFCTYNSMKGTYIIPGGSLGVFTETKELTCTGNSVKAVYEMNLDGVYVSKFELNFSYSIDSDE